MFMMADRHLIALDTNILLKDPWLRSQKMRMLMDFVSKTGSQILLSEVVVMELQAGMHRRFRDQIERIAQSIKSAQQNGITEVPEFDDKAAYETVTSRWNKHFMNAIQGHKFRLVPIDNSVLSEVVKRATERKPPCKSDGEGVRDAVIWLNIIGFCINIKYDYQLSHL